MTYSSELIRSGLFFSDLWNIGFALFDLNNNAFYLVSNEFSSLTGITDTTSCNKNGNPLQGLISLPDFEITEKIFDFIRTEKASEKQNHRYELSFHLNVRLLKPTEQFTHLTFNIQIEPDHEGIRPNTLSFTCIPEQLFGYDRFTLHNLATNKILYYSAGTNRFVKKQQIELNKIEKSILSYINNGLVEAKIATQLNSNINLVKYYKKSIFRKLHVDKTAEAIYIVTHCGMI